MHKLVVNSSKNQQTKVCSCFLMKKNFGFMAELNSVGEEFAALIFSEKNNFVKKNRKFYFSSRTLA